LTFGQKARHHNDSVIAECLIKKGFKSSKLWIESLVAISEVNRYDGRLHKRVSRKSQQVRQLVARGTVSVEWTELTITEHHLFLAKLSPVLIVGLNSLQIITVFLADFEPEFFLFFVNLV